MHNELKLFNMAHGDWLTSDHGDWVNCTGHVDLGITSIYSKCWWSQVGASPLQNQIATQNHFFCLQQSLSSTVDYCHCCNYQQGTSQPWKENCSWPACIKRHLIIIIMIIIIIDERQIFDSFSKMLLQF